MMLIDIIKIISLLSLILGTSVTYATSLVKIQYNEHSLSYVEAKKIGFKAEITSSSVRPGIFEFRIAVPEQIEGKKIESILSEILIDKQSIALLHMSTYSQEKRGLLSSLTNSKPEHKRYFYMDINPKVINKTILTIWCEGGNSYITEINISSL